MNRIKFLGIGAGDIGMVMQVVPTFSIYAELDGLKFLIDPGPGTCINARIHNINLLELDGIFLSHLHQDHSAGVGVALTGIREKKTSFLVAEEHCLMESERYFPCVSKWHQNIPNKMIPVEPGEHAELHGLKIKAVKCMHYDPCVGFLIKGSKAIGYTSDGGYYKDQEKEYNGSDLVIFNTMTPRGLEGKVNYHKNFHMSTDGAIEFLQKNKPGLAVITHYSIPMLKANPKKQAEIIQRESGVKTIAAMPGMEINLDSLGIENS
ncbi:MAG: MBL fold metallo-hydrolase [Candidatus Aenigmarchaeota archaeon]|nr:MBL fold metallo-hydrolase [Candidatus Aenigmarchaeota archaeon]